MNGFLSLEQLVEIVRNDDNCRYPYLERLLRKLMGDPWCPTTTRGYYALRFTRINDSEGLLRSLQSRTTCGRKRGSAGSNN